MNEKSHPQQMVAILTVALYLQNQSLYNILSLRKLRFHKELLSSTKSTKCRFLTVITVHGVSLVQHFWLSQTLHTLHIGQQCLTDVFCLLVIIYTFFC